MRSRTSTTPSAPRSRSRCPPAPRSAQIVVVHSFSASDVVSFPRLVVRAGPGAHVTRGRGVRQPRRPRAPLAPGHRAGRRPRRPPRHASVQVLGDTAGRSPASPRPWPRAATLRAGTAAFGGDYSRLRVDTALAGRGAHGDLFAGYFGSGTQLLDFRTFQDHVAPDTTSNLLFKGALDEKGASVYTGLIKIRPEARGSQAFQTNRNLKLSDDAWAESVPNLEIENNEVQCSHASTVGPIDAEQRFYLESRGVPADRAERLIVKGFFDEVIEALPLGPYERVVRAELDRRARDGAWHEHPHLLARRHRARQRHPRRRRRPPPGRGALRRRRLRHRRPLHPRRHLPRRGRGRLRIEDHRVLEARQRVRPRRRPARDPAGHQADAHLRRHRRSTARSTWSSDR